MQEERHKGGICGCTLYEPEVFGVQDDRQGFEEREQIHMQTLWQYYACRRKCCHQHQRQLHYPGHAIRAGCSQSAVGMGCHRQTGHGACGQNAHVQAFRLVLKVVDSTLSRRLHLLSREKEEDFTNVGKTVNCKNKCNRKVDATKCEHKKVCLSLTDCR